MSLRSERSTNRWMNPQHFYCMLSGGRYFQDEHEFCEAVTEFRDDYAKGAQLSDVIMDGLLYSQEDVDASSNFVLINEREGSDDSDDSTAWLTQQSNLQVMEFFDVTPEGDEPDDGEFQCEGNHFNMYTDNQRVLIMYTAYLIMKQASPRLTPHIVFQLELHPGLDTILHDIDYGPVNGIHMNFKYYVNWTRISDVSYDNDEEQLDFWYRMLTQEGKTDEEILHDAWRGPGNMWVFVRPDRFPVAETLAAKPLLVISGYSLPLSGVKTTKLDTLPLDILTNICHWLPVKSLHMILCTNRRLRGEILPHADTIAHQQIITHEPHLLPAGPFDLEKNHGREEIDWWELEWAKGGIAKEELNAKIPWFLYRMECSKCMSMWNRRRIWGIAKELEKLAIENGYLSSSVI